MVSKNEQSWNLVVVPPLARMLERIKTKQPANKLGTCEKELANNKSELQRQVKDHRRTVTQTRDELVRNHNETVQQQQNRHRIEIHTLEKSHRNDIKTMQKEISLLKEDKIAMERDYNARLQDMKVAYQKELDDMMRTAEEEKAQLIQKFKNDMETLKTSHGKEISGLRRDNEVLKGVLVARVHNKALSDHEVSSNFQNLSVQPLDVALDVNQALLFKESIFPAPEEDRIYRSLSLKLCALCQIPKFISAPQSNNRQSSIDINEFPKQFNKMPCRHSAICAECLSKSLLESIRKDWWYNLGSRNWFRCPIATCHQIMPIRHASELTAILTDLGIRDVEAQLQMYTDIILMGDHFG
jgi:hypothetical protein